MPERYRDTYFRRAKSTTDVPVIPISLITNKISSENSYIPSLSVDVVSQSDLDVHITHR